MVALPELVARDVVRSAWHDAWSLPPDLLLSEWANTRRYLITSPTPFPGQWDYGRTPYLVDIVNALSSYDPCEWVIVIKGAQVGVTDGVVIMWLGYNIDVDPSDQLLILPTLTFAKKYKQLRIQTMINDCPTVSARTAAERSRGRRNTALFVEYEGGRLSIAGANSTVSLGSEPVGRIAMDEVDRFKDAVGAHGSPVALAEGRATMFPIKKFCATSTPTIRDESEIESLFLLSDQRYFHLRCPHCGHRDFLTWQGYRDFLRRIDPGHHEIKWTRGEPDTAAMLCGNPTCRKLTAEGFKKELLAEGTWIPTPGAGDGRRKGFHVSGLLSPPGAFTWATAARQFLERKSDPTKLQVWVNEVLGETFELTPMTVELVTFLQRAEEWAGEVPPGVALITMASDTQHDHLHYMVMGWGVGEQMWILDRGRIDGDPSVITGTVEEPSVWQRLNAIRRKPWRHVSGRDLYVQGLAVDTGGDHTDAAYEFCRKYQSRGVYAIRGGNDPTMPILGKVGKSARGDLRVHTIGVDAGKDIVWSRLNIAAPGPGYVHVPKGRPWTEGPGGVAFVDEVFSEKRKRVLFQGRYTRRWVKRRESARNEEWDCMVYNTWMFRALPAAWRAVLEHRAEKLNEPVERETGAEDAPKQPPPPREPSRPTRGLPSGRRARGIMERRR